jgi:GR25 family glycosyltransferase involved in LPS biosynthesis
MVTINNIKIADLGFYINMDYRTDRNENILKNFEEYNIKGIERHKADTSTTSGAWNLVKSNFEIYKKFLETDAEVLLVLEDDCIFLPSIKENTEEIINDIYSNDWDIFWIGNVNRRPPVYYNNNCYRVSSTNYSQSYLIKRRMAEDILNHFDPNWRHLGIDEMICLFTYGIEIAHDPNKFDFYGKQQPLDHFTPEYISLCYKIALTTQYNSYSDNWNNMANLEEWIPLHSPEPYQYKSTTNKNMKLITITWNYEDSYDISDTFLYKSFIKNNNPDNLIQIHFNRNNYKDLEDQFSEKYGFQYEYILYKVYLLMDRIKNVSADYIIMADAFDTVCLDDINTITPNNYILFSSEANIYPYSKGDWGVSDYSEENINSKNFLNSGLIMAPKGDYINLLYNAIHNILTHNLKSFGGDQGIFTYHYLNKSTPIIHLDKNCNLFLSTYLRDHNSFVKDKLPIFVHDNGWNYGSPRFIEKFNLI